MKINNSYILLKNICFYAYHGVVPQETKIGNEFIINLRLETDIYRASETDEITNTVSYADVYEVLKEEMEIPSKLLEYVCRRICIRLFKEFHAIKGIEISLAKRNPPMGADIEAAGIELKASR